VSCDEYNQPISQLKVSWLSQRQHDNSKW